MPELDFLFNNDDEIKLLEYLFKTKCMLVIDKHYLSEEPVIIKEFREYKNLNYDNLQFFIINEKYSNHSLVFRGFEKENNRYYYISQREGCPTIDLSIYHENNEPFVGHASISYHSTIFNIENKLFEKIPNELKGMFKDITKIIKMDSKKISTGVRSFWVIPGAISEIVNGKKIRNFSGFELEILKYKS